MTATAQPPRSGPGAPPPGGRPRSRGPFERVLDGFVDHPWPVLLVILAVAVYLIISSSGGPQHRLTAVFTDAKDLASGSGVEVNGIIVGSISSIQVRDGQAVVAMNIKKDWPLPEGTKADTRWGTTLGEGTRYVQLIPGPNGAPPLSDGAVIPVSDTNSAVELDQVFNMFNPKTKAALQQQFAAGAADFKGETAQIGTSIQGANVTANGASGLLGDLMQNQGALSSLVTQANETTQTLAQRASTLSDVLQVAADTMTEFGTHTQDIVQSLNRFTPTLDDAKVTLAQTDGTISDLTGLVNDLRPGLVALHPFLAAARPALAGLRTLAPLGASTLTTLVKSGPSVTNLLKVGQPFARRLNTTLAGLSPDVACIRPYGPEIAAFFTQWDSWAQDYDSISHYARIQVNEGPTSITSTPDQNTNTFLTGLGGTLKYADPRPPGLNAGTPDYLPQCGAGVNSTNPVDDPESH